MIRGHIVKNFSVLSILSLLLSVYTGNCFGQGMSGNYDIGGGANHYSTIVSAVSALTSRGMSGPVTFNVYPGAYNGQALIQNIAGLGEQNPLIFQAASEDRPVVTNPATGTYEGNGFLLRGVRHVTIRGFEFQNCGYCGIQTYYGNSSGDSCAHITIEDNYFNQTSTYMMHTYQTNHALIINNEFNATGLSYGFRVRYTTNSIVANNMAYGATSYGIYTYNSSSAEYYFNSIYASGSRTFYLGGSSSTGCIIKNNIFYNSGTSSSYAAYYYTNSNPVSDYNCYWAPNANVGYYGAACQTLVQFQAATGGDAHSIEADPAFISLTDLHISDTSQCINAGTGIPGIDFDFDGERRHRDIPCIGCDEIGGLRVKLIPRYPPYILPAGGGIMHITAEVENNADSGIVFDAWTEIILPNGHTYGPLVLYRSLFILPARVMRASFSQLIPSFAPSGDYAYVGKCGDYPDSVMAEDSFPFIKVPGDDASSHYHNWAVSGGFESGDEISIHNSQFTILNSSPNPFNPATAITFHLPAASEVKLSVYDIAGREVASLVNGHLSSGHHEIAFNGTELASGVYFAALEAGGVKQVRKMLLVK